MKVLLDENLPHSLRHALGGHEVSTAAYVGWSGVKNGELLRLAEAHGFEVLVTADRNMQHQQDLRYRTIAMVFLTAQRWEVLSLHLPRIVEAVDASFEGSLVTVECG